MVRTTPPALSLLDSGEEVVKEDNIVEVVVGFTALETMPLSTPSIISCGRESEKKDVSTLESCSTGGERKGVEDAV
jgi:hypothetical protein